MNSIPKPPRSPRPSDGERRAVRNLSAQYLVAAALVYEAIGSGELEWVRLVDPDAGRLDDVVLGRSGRVDAYQIKWSEYRHTVTFNDLVTQSRVSGKPYPAPFLLMADGWKSLRTKYPHARIHAHYLMHDAPSSADGKGERTREDKPTHLQSFLKNAYSNRANWFAPGSDVYATWKDRIDKVAEATRLQGEQLSQFLSDSELDLGFDVGPEGWKPSAWADVEALAYFFLKQVSDSSGAGVELTTNDIVRGLRWGKRYDLRFKHDFPVDERLYRPIEPTVQALEAAIGAFNRGYVALIGPPGSGKSTTLTHVLRYRKGIRLIRYYAFLRDDPQLGRGEALAFLHDLCVQLEAMGLGRTSRRDPHPDTLHGLRDRLTGLFRELGDEAEMMGGRTIILVDGLDHIEREQHPTRSLIEELPAPNSLPASVLIILGTQPVGLRGPSPTLRPINAQLEDPGRKIVMQPLSRASIHEIARTALPASRLRATDVDTIVQLSAGHPLSLAYLIKRLASAPDDASAQALLDAEPDFGGDTNAEYGGYWDGLAGDAEVRDLLALVARIRGAVELSTIGQLAPHEAVCRFADMTVHLFRQLTPSRWSFFHNSFRQFVLSKTQLDPFGNPDPGANARFHHRLAAIAAQSTSPRELRWQELYHLEQAGEPGMLVERAQQQRFRYQFLDGRRISEIAEDLHRALKAVAAIGDGVAIARLLLIESELDDRHDVLSQTDFQATLLELSEPEELASLLLMSDELLVPNDLALRWSARLAETRSDGLGLKLFEAAEPMNVLAGVERAERVHDQGLDDWARAAWRFRPLDRLVAAVGNVRGRSGHGRRGAEMDDPEADDAARLELLTQIGIGIQDAQDEVAYAEFASILAGAPLGPAAMLRLAFRAARLFVAGVRTVGNPAEALAQVLAVTSPTDLSKHEAATFADVVAQIPSLANRADEYLQHCSSPLLVSELKDPGTQAFVPVEALFRQARAMAARGKPMNIAAVPAPDRKWDEGLVLFQRLTIVVGTLWGEAIAGRTLSADAFLRRAMPVLAFRRRGWQESFQWHHWYVITDALTILHQHLLGAAEAHGRPVFESVLAAFEKEWMLEGGPGMLGWPMPSRRHIAMSAYRIDRDAARVSRHLTEIEASIDGSWDLSERLAELCALAKDWIEIGEKDQAKGALFAALSNSFGIYHDKDHQIENWGEWVARLARGDVEPALVERAATTVLRLIPQLFETNRGRGTSKATSDVFGALADRWPTSALEMAEWLLDLGKADRATSIAALLAAELRSGNDTRIANGLVVAARLLLPFSSYETVFADALKSVVANRLTTGEMTQTALEHLRRAAQSIAVSGSGYLDVLQGGEGTEDDDGGQAVAEPDERSPPSLTLADGTVLSRDEVRALARRPQDLAKALVGSSATSGLDWTNIIGELFANGGNTTVRLAARLVLKQSLSIPTLEAFVRAATTAGETELADAAIAVMVANGRPYGWAKFYDGGSRYRVSRALRTAHPVDGRTRSLRLFVADYIEHGLSAKEQVLHLGELLEEFVEGIPLPELWREIEEHITGLADWLSSDFRPPAIGLGLEAQVPEIAVGLLARDIDQLPGSLAWEARRGLLDLIDLGDSSGSARAALASAIDGDFRKRSAGLATLECLAFKRPDVALLYADRIKALAWDISSVTRFAARNILEQIDIEIPPAPKPAELPAFYRLHIPEASKPEVSLSGDGSAPGQPLPDTDDPFDLTRMFHPTLRALGAEADIPFDALARRMAMLMRVVAPPEAWSADVERRFTQHNDSIGLKLTYRRPRSLVAQHAFGMLITELCDAGAVEWVPSYAREILLVADPPGNLIDPASKPHWLGIPDGEDLGRHPSKDWLAAASEALPIANTASDGRIVLAELTRVTSRSNERAEEIRSSVIAHKDWRFDEDAEPSVEDFLHREWYLARDYPVLWRLDHDTPFVAIAGGSLFSDVRFLALNPHVGFEMGWTPAMDGLFRWVDRSGATVVESVRWASGNVEVHDAGGYKQRAAEGWLVLVSPQGWDVLAPKLVHAVRHRRAARMTGYKRSGERGTSVASDRVPI